jgi:hypothetical protein
MTRECVASVSRVSIVRSSGTGEQGNRGSEEKYLGLTHSHNDALVAREQVSR